MPDNWLKARDYQILTRETEKVQASIVLPALKQPLSFTSYTTLGNQSAKMASKIEWHKDQRRSKQ